MAYHESLRWCDRCAREARHWREDFVDGPRSFRWILLAPLALLVTAWRAGTAGSVPATTGGTMVDCPPLRNATGPWVILGACPVDGRNSPCPTG